jgi:ATP-grasp domain
MEKVIRDLEDMICIVDAYSTGKKLAAEFNKYGKKCIHIKSSKNNANDPRRTEFLEEILFEGSMNKLENSIRKFNPTHIIAGSEMGIELADKLVASFNLSDACDPNTTQFRRNKYFMHERLKEKGIPSIRQFKSSSISEIFQWSENLGTWPIVIKPLNSAASDGVTICEDISEVRFAFERIFNQENKLGIQNKEVLVQEYLDGTQYFVNTVSWDGKHYISDIWIQNRKRLKGRAFLFESMSLCPSTGSIENELCEYTKKILNALNLSHGAAHNEIMWTKEGPVLIELNARLMGASIDDSSFMSALGYTQAQLLALAYVSPKEFINNYIGQNYRIFKKLSEVSFIFHKDGLLKSFPKKQLIENMESFHCFTGVPELESYVKKTEDTIGLPGYVYLLHEDRDVVNSNMNEILTWQSNNEIFEIE